MKLPPADYGMPSDGRIPALSFRLPWPYAILELRKRIENREKWRSCAYRGPLILHVAGWPTGNADKLACRPTKDALELLDMASAMLEMAKMSGIDPYPVTLRTLLSQRSGAFGVCDLLGVITGPAHLNELIDKGRIPATQKAWYMGGFALILGRVRPIPFVSCAGALGLFGIHREAYDQLQLAA